MATPLELSTRPGAGIVTVTGEIDMSNADRFATRSAWPPLAADGGSFVVDLTGVELFSTAPASRPVRARCANPAHRRPLLEPVLTISGLSDITSVSSRRERL